MTNLKTQRKLAAKILKCGKNRVWINPNNLEEISKAITKYDIRELIAEGLIKKKRKKGTSRGKWRDRMKKRKKGRGKGHGSRKGKMGARKSKKRKWMERIRAIRDELKKLKKEDKISQKTYRMLYKLSKSGEIKSRKRLREYIEKHELEE